MEDPIKLCTRRVRVPCWGIWVAISHGGEDIRVWLATLTTELRKRRTENERKRREVVFLELEEVVFGGAGSYT